MSTKLVKDIHVLFIPAWFPTIGLPYSAPFIPEQARAIQRHTPTQIGFIYRQDFSLNKKRKLRSEYLEPFPHIVVTRPYIPKISPFFIKLWCRQYQHAFNIYVKRFGKPDIIHAHGYVAGFAARYIAFEAHIPFVLTEHATSLISANIRSGQISTLKKTLKETSCTIAVSGILRRALMSFTSRDIDVIPNLYDDEVFLLKRAKSTEIFRIALVGNLINRKRIDLLLCAFEIARRQDKNLYLDIVGVGVLKKTLESQSQNLGLEAHVRFHGACSPVDVANILNRSDLCVSTSEVETFGITLIEAMACGVPIVATPSGGPQEIVTKATGIIMENWNPQSIATSILLMKRNQNEYQREVIAEYAKNRFGSEVIADHIFEVYRDLCPSL